MKLNIVSWNTCGSSIEKISDVYGSLFLGGDVKNIILIQEAGALDDKYYNTTIDHTFGKKKFCGYFVPQPNAKNERCTTGIWAEKSIFSTPPKFATMDSGQKRPVVSVGIKSDDNYFILSTVHAVAREIIAAKEMCNIFYTLGQGNQSWLLLGDFNCNPNNLIKAGVPEDNISHPKAGTQSGGGVLDYAVFSDDFKGRIEVKSGCPKPGKNSFFPGTSDHIPVFVQFEI